MAAISFPGYDPGKKKASFPRSLFYSRSYPRTGLPDFCEAIRPDWGFNYARLPKRQKPSFLGLLSKKYNFLGHHLIMPEIFQFFSGIMSKIEARFVIFGNQICPLAALKLVASLSPEVTRPANIIFNSSREVSSRFLSKFRILNAFLKVSHLFFTYHICLSSFLFF